MARLRIDPQIARYAASTFGKSLPWAAADSFALFFLTEIAGVPGTTAGLLVMAFFAWAAVCDPLSGWLFDRYRRSGRSERAYYRIAAPAAAAGLAATFWAAPEGPWRIAGLLAAGLVFRTAYAAMDVPHNALLARLAWGKVDPVGLGATRLVAALSGSLLAVAAARPMLDAPTGQAAFLYAAAMGLIGAVLFLGFLPHPAPEGPRADARASGPAAASWPAVIAFFLAAFLVSVVAGLFAKDLVYIAKYVLGRPDWTVEAFALLTLGKFAAAPAWTAVARSTRPVTGLKAAFALTIAVTFVLALLPPTTQTLRPGLVLLGLALGGVNMLSWALLPSLAPAGWSTGRFFGAYTAVGKLAAGASGLLLGVLLSSLMGGEPEGEPTLAFYRAMMAPPVIGAIGGLICIEASDRLMRLRR